LAIIEIGVHQTLKYVKKCSFIFLNGSFVSPMNGKVVLSRKLYVLNTKFRIDNTARKSARTFVNWLKSAIN
jgi:hypothetical protein